MNHHHAPQEKFLSGFERRVSHLSGCVEILRKPLDVHGTTATVEAMMRGFHSVAGIGGLYGFRDITAIARMGELTCRTLRAPVRPKQVTSLTEIVNALTSAADSAWVSVDPAA